MAQTSESEPTLQGWFNWKDAIGIATAVAPLLLLSDGTQGTTVSNQGHPMTVEEEYAGFIAVPDSAPEPQPHPVDNNYSKEHGVNYYELINGDYNSYHPPPTGMDVGFTNADTGPEYITETQAAASGFAGQVHYPPFTPGFNYEESTSMTPTFGVNLMSTPDALPQV